MNNLGVKMMMHKKVAVLYHYPCHDGVFAALAAHLYLSAKSIPSLFFPNTVYSPITINQLPLQEISHLYLLDFTGPPGFVHKVSPKVEHVVILDHHKTAIESLGDDVSFSNVTKVLDVERSGATIAYDYFTQKLMEEEESCSREMNDFKRMRRVFEYIEDADIWKWKLPESKAFNSGILDLRIEYDFNQNQSLFEELLSLDHESVINRGKESLCRKRKLIQEALDKSFEIVLGGNEEFGRCLAVNADEIAELRSELGNQLAEKSKNLKLRGVGAVVYRVPELGDETKVKISLRSVGEEDTTVVSQRFGGGGHRNASSFLLSSIEFEQWKEGGVKKL
uniref:DHHA1 domain-containing protein n=1 Tax=Noccaea caerulescens TaxID=107243 RepID=A0A1J3FCJ4_NOCCA